MANLALLGVLVVLTVTCLAEAQLRRDSIPARPFHPIVIKPPPPPPRTRINIEGGGGTKQHSMNGRIEHDFFRSKGGPVIMGWGEGSHSRDPIQGINRQGQVGVGVRFPIGGRKH